MARTGSTTYESGNQSISLRNRTTDDILAAITLKKGRTLFEIAETAEVSVHQVRKVIKFVPQAQQLVREGYVAISSRGPIPDWAVDVSDLPRVTTTALVTPPDLPKSIAHPELRDEVTEKVNHVRRILRRTSLSPKSQKRELKTLTDLEVVGAEREQQYMSYIDRLEDERQKILALNEALRERALLLQAVSFNGEVSASSAIPAETQN